MNQAIIYFFKANLNQNEIKNKDVIEIGSRYINGSVKQDIESKQPASYVGIDMEPGRNVDVVCEVKDIPDKFHPESFDIVVSCELLEHVLDFRETIHIIKSLVKIGGLIMISTRSKGFGYHGCPHDFWRYEIEDMQSLFADCEIINLVSDGNKGVILKARKISHDQCDITDIKLYNIIYDKPMCCEPALLEEFVKATGIITRNSYFQDYNKLLSIGEIAGTDKVEHNYLRKYEFFVKTFKKRRFNLLL